MGENSTAPGGSASLAASLSKPKPPRLAFHVSEVENGYIVSASGVDGEYRDKQFTAVSDAELIQIISEAILKIPMGTDGRVFQRV